MNNIIVATDLSSRSDRAVSRAFSLGKKLGVPVTLVSVVDSAMPEKITDKLKAEVSENLQNVVNAHDGSANTEVLVLVGDVVEEITRLAEEKSPALVVLGLHRRRRFMDGLRQTTMERIVALSGSSVLLVIESAEHAYNNVLLPISYSPACSKAVSVAQMVAPEAKFSSFHALHIPFAGLTGGENSDMEKSVRRECEAQGQTWQETHGVSIELPEIVIGGPAAVLYQKINADKPDLIAIGAHTRAGIALHRIGTFASELVRDPPTDLLIAKN